MAIELLYNLRGYAGTAAELGASTTVWPNNVLLHATDSKAIKIGNGEDIYSALSTLNTGGAVDLSSYAGFQIRTTGGWESDTSKYAKGWLLIDSETGEMRVTPLKNKTWAESVVIVSPYIAKLVLSAEPADVLKVRDFAYIDGKFYIGDGVTEFSDLEPLLDETAAKIVLTAEPTDVLGDNVFAFIDGELFVGDGVTEFSDLEPAVGETTLKIVRTAEPTEILGANVMAFVDDKLYLGDGATEFSQLLPLIDLEG